MRFLLSRISLRWQLAILYVVCLSAALGLLGLGLFGTLSYILDQTVYSELTADASRLASTAQLQVVAPPASNRPLMKLPVSGPDGPGAGPMVACGMRWAGPCPSAATTPAPTVATAAALAAAPAASTPVPVNLGFDRAVPPNVGARFVDDGDHIVAQGGDGAILRSMVVPPAPLVAALAASGQTEERITGRNPGRVAVLYEPATTADGVHGVLEVGASMNQIDMFLSIFHFALLIGGIGALGGGTFLALGLTRRLLQPLRRIAGVSWTVATGDLTRRFTGPTGSREVSTLARNFNHMIDRLEASLRSQQRFTADAAHELRTPLTALGGNVELLLLGADEGDPQRVQKVLRSMDLEIQRLTRLVNDLLQISRLEGQVQLQLAPVDLAALVQDVAAELRLVAPDARLDVRTEGSLIVAGDRDRLKQVLLNIGDNALKFTPPGGTVTVTGGRLGGVARLRVTDSGPGIPPGDLPRIFDRFYRSDTSRARSSGGMGLGLAIAKAIVEAHRGTIVASSIVGRGASFTIDLPLDPAAMTVAPPVPKEAVIGRKDGAQALVNGVIASARREKGR